jgi:hypothetical protein
MWSAPTRRNVEGPRHLLPGPSPRAEMPDPRQPGGGSDGELGAMIVFPRLGHPAGGVWVPSEGRVAPYPPPCPHDAEDPAGALANGADLELSEGTQTRKNRPIGLDVVTSRRARAGGHQPSRWCRRYRGGLSSSGSARTAERPTRSTSRPTSARCRISAAGSLATFASEATFLADRRCDRRHFGRDVETSVVPHRSLLACQVLPGRRGRVTADTGSVRYRLGEPNTPSGR